MSIRDWEGVALIVGAGDIGKCIFDHLSVLAPKLEVILCGRNQVAKGIYLDLENDQSIISLEKEKLA